MQNPLNLFISYISEAYWPPGTGDELRRRHNHSAGHNYNAAGGIYTTDSGSQQAR